MKKTGILNSIKELLIIILVAGILTAAFDYLQMISGNVPIFNKKSYDEKTKVQSFRGLFYKAERKITTSENESLVDSTEMKYAFLIFNITVPKQFKEVEKTYTISTKIKENCQEQSKLYYADKNIKVYTYCLDEINVSENGKTASLENHLRKETNILDEIDSKLAYFGLYQNQKALIFKDINDISNQGLTMFRCNQTNINDVYFAPKDTVFQEDFCTYKDDDFRFIFEIEEENLESTTTTEKEIFFEDENYLYEFETEKSNNVFIKTPAVRGKIEMKYPLKDILNNNILTPDDLAKKGLKFNKISKTEGNLNNTAEQQ